MHAVVFGSDLGLVGRFNDALVEHTLPTLLDQPATRRVLAVGGRMSARLADAGVPVAGMFAVPST